MHTVEEHINYLFYLKNDFVLPKIGFFYSKYEEAKYEEKKRVYSPKNKEILFTNEVEEDREDFFINYISKKENIPEEEAREKVYEYIIHLKKDLDNDGVSLVSNIGSFLYNEKKELIFKFNKNYNFEVNSFGLTPIYNQGDSRKKYTPKRKTIYREGENISKDFKLKTVSVFWTKILKYIVIIYAILMGGYLYYKNISYIKNIPDMILNKSAMVDFSYNQNDSIITETKEIYCVIIASFNSNEIKKIKRFIKEFTAKHKEYTLEIIEDKKVKRKRISCGRFENREKAEKYLNKVRSIIKNSWLYITKNK